MLWINCWNFVTSFFFVKSYMQAEVKPIVVVCLERFQCLTSRKLSRRPSVGQTALVFRTGWYWFKWTPSRPQQLAQMNDHMKLLFYKIWSLIFDPVSFWSFTVLNSPVKNLSSEFRLHVYIQFVYTNFCELGNYFLRVFPIFQYVRYEVIGLLWNLVTTFYSRNEFIHFGIL